MYFRKGAIFLLLPLLLIQLNRNSNTNYASYALWISLITALGYAGSKIWGLGIDNWYGQRIESFWDVGRWSEVLGYSIAVLVPLTLEQTSNKRRKMALTGTLILALAFLIFSGGRGPFLALMVSCSLYLLYRKPSLLVAVAIVCSLFLYKTKELPQVHAVTERIVSIADLHNNDSNNARLAIWSQGAAFSLSLLQESPHTFLLGTGIEQFEGLFTEFLQKSTNIELLLASTNNQFSFKDLHNTYLDLAVKLGAIYSLFFIVLLVVILISFCKNAAPTSPWGYSGACLMLTYFVNSMFYTSGLEYQTTIFFLIIALCHTQLNQDTVKSTANV
ncbi:O-antigen ligase family protein [Vibrio sinaloensis]|uniref:O-antigen ligase family protein n=1 Tax=Photobacterium sp. (strain ATCC 43367) TaxID=379097 RepID=UPI0022AFD77F|nr:O-antigen ligase family protein [Vibrio sinaloensis]MCZ4294794.1 O-antigen ligase family protein [Vibrio sinaloensis]